MYLGKPICCLKICVSANRNHFHFSVFPKSNSGIFKVNKFNISKASRFKMCYYYLIIFANQVPIITGIDFPLAFSDKSVES